MTSGASGEEIGLINTSAASASDSLKFMRIAYGAASKTEVMGAPEISSIASAHLGTQRLTVEWTADQRDLSRASAKLVLLMAQATAAAAPLGGVLSIENADPGGFPYEIGVVGQKIAFSAQAAQALKGAVDLDQLEPRFAAFVLLALTARAAGYNVDWRMTGDAGRLVLR